MVRREITTFLKVCTAAQGQNHKNCGTHFLCAIRSGRESRDDCIEDPQEKQNAEVASFLSFALAVVFNALGVSFLFFLHSRLVYVTDRVCFRTVERRICKGS